MQKVKKIWKTAVVPQKSTGNMEILLSHINSIVCIFRMSKVLAGGKKKKTFNNS